MTRERYFFLSCLACLVFIVLALPPDSRAEVAARGKEFQVNSYTSADQRHHSVSSDAEGDFVAVWESRRDGYFDIFARRFSSSGFRLATEFMVNTYTNSHQTYPSVAAEANGDFVVVWESFQDGSGPGVFGRRFTSAGTPLASEFQVNTYTRYSQYRERVASDADGDFIVGWESSHEGSYTGIFAQRFSSLGVRLASEFQVNTFTTGSQRFPVLAASADGDFVVAWPSYTLPFGGQDGSYSGVFAQHFASDGTPLASEFQVNTYTSSAQRSPTVEVSASGDFVIAWHGGAQDGADYGIFARRFSSAGVPQASEFQVNTFTSGSQSEPSAKTVAGGDFIVAWSSYQDGFGNGTFARRFSSAGVPQASELQVNTYTSSNTSRAAVAALAAGGFVVAWESYGQDGSSFGIFGQRFAEPPFLDIDGDGSIQALTDGLLVLRRLFNFSGTTLTNSVTGGDCTRCDAATIIPYISGLGLTLDVDGDGATEALTDGLLVLRFLFGFTGTTLTNGVVDTGNCTRCDAAAIVPYLQGLL